MVGTGCFTVVGTAFSTVVGTGCFTVVGTQSQGLTKPRSYEVLFSPDFNVTVDDSGFESLPRSSPSSVFVTEYPSGAVNFTVYSTPGVRPSTFQRPFLSVVTVRGSSPSADTVTVTPATGGSPSS